MTYTKRTDVPAEPGETVMALDTGLLVAVSCRCKLLLDNRMCFHALARAIDEDGVPLLDAGGNPIVREFKHSAPVGVDSETMARDCMLAVLGEKTPEDLNPLGMRDAVLARYNIRLAVEAAPAVGQVDAGAVL